MNTQDEKMNSNDINEKNEIFEEPKINEEFKDSNYIDEQIREDKLDEKSIEIKDEYKFGWSSYSEKTNGRFAMLGFLAIILIELLSNQSFLQWAGIL